MDGTGLKYLGLISSMTTTYGLLIWRDLPMYDHKSFLVGAFAGAAAVLWFTFLGMLVVYLREKRERNQRAMEDRIVNRVKLIVNPPPFPTSLREK